METTWNLDSSDSSLLTTAAAAAAFLLQQPRGHPLNSEEGFRVVKDAEDGDRMWNWASSLKFLVSLVGLVLFNGTVVLGNSLVILAVFTHSKLRPTTTNKFIVSLAVADLLVGITVLPFSSANQMLRFWPFGRVWCRMWLAVDVWLCTASILNLCAISVDRYLAISRPFKYPHLMSPSRAKLLIVSVWILSFIICFPPLLGWDDPTAVAYDNASPSSSSSSLFMDKGGTASDKAVEVKGIWQKSDELFESNDDSYEHLFSAPDPYYFVHLGDSTSSPPSNSSVVGRSSTGGGGRMMCTLTSEPGYIIYSSCGSFWVPMLLMLIFYWKIYKTATSATAAFRRGFIEKKSVLSKTNSSSQAQTTGSLTLRVHRGSRITMRHSNGCISELLPPVTAVSLQLTRRSFDSQLAARNIGPVPSGAVQSAIPRASVVASPLSVVEAKSLPPKIVVTASPSTGEEAKEGKKEEESRGMNERKESIFSVDDKIKIKDGEKNDGGEKRKHSLLLSTFDERKEKEEKGDRNKRRKSSILSIIEERKKRGIKPNMMPAEEEKKEPEKKKGKNDRRKSSIFSMDEEKKWEELENRRGIKSNILPTQERKEQEERSGRYERRKSSIFSMDDERKWRQLAERRGIKPNILPTQEERKEPEEKGGNNERRKSSIFSMDEERKWKELEERRGRITGILSTHEERKEPEEISRNNERRKSSIFSMDEERKWKELEERRGRNSSILSTHEERKELEEKSGNYERRKSSIFSIDEDRQWKDRDDRRIRKPNILSTAEERKLKEADDRKGGRKQSILSTEGVKGYGSVDTSRKNSFLEETTDESGGTEKRSSLISVRLSKLNFIAQLRSLNREKKAAKTVGVIVGCFIVCWAPFFTVYLLGAFCRSCTPPSLFHVFFWLGYCNSAINPFVYGLCSKEFRYAFQKLLRCRCEQRRDDVTTTLSHNNQSTTTSGTKGVSRLHSVLRGFKLQIATRNTSTSTSTSPALATAPEDRPVMV